MTLHLVRLGIDRRALATFAATRRIADDDTGYALHCALVARFGDAAPRPFRFLPDHGRGPRLLGYVADAAKLAEAASLPSTDDLLHEVFTGTPDVRTMPETWRAGARYGFEVRARPVVRYGKSVRAARQARDGAWQPRASEIDAFVAACERHVNEGGDAADVDREAVYVSWLAARLAAAATLDQAALRLFQRSRTRRSTHQPGTTRAVDGTEIRIPRTHAVEGPDAVLAGTLTVADPDAFAALLARGLGRHAAFGYGMVLLSAPGRAG